jgi:hypothetical protein
MEPANPEQLRLLIALHHQLGVPYDATELAGLSKWDASERISILRGRPASTSNMLDVALLDVLRVRAQNLGEDEPTPPVPAPEGDNQPSRRRR